LLIRGIVVSAQNQGMGRRGCPKMDRRDLKKICRMIDYKATEDEIDYTLGF
jgi:hypothetical protein